jgi:hypothetical protein
MFARLILAVSLLASIAATSASAQVFPDTRWAFGVGFARLFASGRAASGSGFGIQGLYAPTFSSRFGLEIEAHALLSGAAEAIPGCVQGAICEARTIVPSGLVGLDARLFVAPDPRLRFSLGPAVAWAPNVNGPNSDPAFGTSVGFGISPFDRTGRGLGLELRGTRFFSRLGEVDWLFGSAISYRFGKSVR